MEKQRKVAIIGAAGQAGRNRRQRLTGEYGLDCSDLVNQVVYFDTSAERLNEQVKQGLVPTDSACSSWPDLIKSAPFDEIFVCTPVNMHHDSIQRIAQAGLTKRVLVEKPLALTLEQGVEMRQIAKSADIQLFCGYHLTMTGPMRRLRERISEIDALHIKDMEITYTKMREAGHSKRHPIAGVISEEIPHVVDLFTAIMGVPQLVQVSEARVIPIRVGEDRIDYADMPGLKLNDEVHEDANGRFCLGWIMGELTAHLSFSRERVGSIHSSFETAHHERSVRIEAARETFPSDPEFGNNFFTWKTSVTSIEPRFREWSGKAEAKTWTAQCIEDRHIDLGDPLGQETHFFLKGEDDVLCDIDRAVNAQAVVEAIAKSAATVGGDQGAYTDIIRPGEAVEVKLPK